MEKEAEGAEPGQQEKEDEELVRDMEELVLKYDVEVHMKITVDGNSQKT